MSLWAVLAALVLFAWWRWFCRAAPRQRCVLLPPFARSVVLLRRLSSALREVTRAAGRASAAISLFGVRVVESGLVSEGEALIVELDALSSMPAHQPDTSEGEE